METVVSRIVEFLSLPMVGTLLGIAGLAVAFVTYVLTRQRRILAFQQRGQKLLGHEAQGLPEAVGVTYRGRAIPRVTKTFVVLWNAGEKVISGTDIVESDRLRIDVGEDAEILSTNVRASTRAVVGLKILDVSARVAEIKFDFLDAGDGAVVELLHTGHRKFVRVAGTVKGLPRGASDRGVVIAVPPVRFRDHLSLEWFVTRPAVQWVILALSCVGVWYAAFGSTLLGGVERTVIGGTAAVYVGFSAAAIWMTRRRFPRALAKALEI
jgi:hypothetical protein